jgi:hypothetical protein
MLAFWLSQMFALICVHTPLANPQALFNRHYKSLTDDSVQINMAKRDSRQLTKKERKVIGLFQLQKIIDNLGSNIEDAGLTIRESQKLAMASIVAEREGRESKGSVRKQLNLTIETFNVQQRANFGEVRQAVDKPTGWLI